MIEQAVQRSKEIFISRAYFCAESVLAAIAESQGIESDLIPRIATGFCGGMARTCGMCGAVTGAMMGLGLINGVAAPGGDHAPNYMVVNRFLARFKEQFGSTNCLDLTGCDLGTPDGYAKFQDEHCFERLCAVFVEAATRMALEAVEE